MKISVLSRVCALMALAMLAVATADSADARLFGGRLLSRGNDCCQQSSYCCEQTSYCAPAASGCEAAPCGCAEAAPCGCAPSTACCGTDDCCSDGIVGGILGGLRGGDCCCETQTTCCEGGRLSGILGNIQLGGNDYGCSTCGYTSCGY